jgi:enterochelin esterase-like enzyme
MMKLRVNTPKVFMEDGIYEAKSMGEGNDDLEKLLQSEKFEYVRHKTPTNHDWIYWKNRLSSIITWYLTNP